MGAQGSDVQLSEAAAQKFPYSVECKSRAKIGLVYEAMAQAGQGSHTPLLVIKQNQSDPLVVIRMEDFFRIISENKKND